MNDAIHVGGRWGLWAMIISLSVLIYGCGDPIAEPIELEEQIESEAAYEATETTLGARQANWPRSNAKDKFRRNPLDKSHDRQVIVPKDDAEEEDDPRFVRETGFRPIDDGMSEVRETGFLPAPVVRLDRVEGEVGVIVWGPVEHAVHYVVNGVRQDDEGNLEGTFELRVEGTTARVDTQGFRTVVHVYSVGQDGKQRSGPSNKVAVHPAD